MLRKKGFTLVELLVVISIIALLMAVLLPALSKARFQAQKIICYTRLADLTKAWMLYAEDNNGDLVFSGTNRMSGGWKNPGVKAYGWAAAKSINGCKGGLLWKYCGNLDSYRCPLDKKMPTNETVGRWKSYSIIDPLNGWYGCPSTAYITHKDRQVYKMANIKRGSEQLVFIEEGEGKYGSDGSWVFEPNPSSYAAPHIIDPFAIWHARLPMGAACWSFADGHAGVKRWTKWTTAEIVKMQDAAARNQYYTPPTPPDSESEAVAEHQEFIRLYDPLR